MLPNYFYDINSVLPDGRTRWYDPFANPYPHVIQPRDLDHSYLAAKRERNEAYDKWLSGFYTKGPNGEKLRIIKPKQMIWQVIRVLRSKHSETSRKDWWDSYQDAVFRVFVQPETFYEKETGEHKQWYLLSPEDCYLVNKHEKEKKTGEVRPRQYRGLERYFSLDKTLRKALFIPVECCHHLRHETTAGELPEGL